MRDNDPIDFDVFAPFYDLDYGEEDDDIDFYRDFSQRFGSPILEVGCGTGRVLLPLAAEGHRVSGVDVSPAMLRVARDRATAAGVTAELLAADIRNLDLPSGFALAIVAADSFMHLTSLDDQQSALRNLHRLIKPAGGLIVDLSNPHPDRLLAIDKELVLAWTRRDPATGQMVSKLVSRETDFAAQLQHLTFFYDRLDQTGQVSRVVAPFVLRYLHRFEMELLLRLNGFQLERVFGDYELNPFDSESERMIFLARREA